MAGHCHCHRLYCLTRGEFSTPLSKLPSGLYTEEEYHHLWFPGYGSRRGDFLSYAIVSVVVGLIIFCQKSGI